MKMRKILVTGGAGFIASCLAEQLIQNPDNYVVIIDNLLTGHKDNLPSDKKKNWTFIRCDANILPDISQVMVSYKFDYVFHYAAVVGVKRTLNNPVKVLEDIEGIRNILNLSKNTGVKRIYYSSSSEVYGEPVEYPQNEDTTPLNSRLPYAVVKNIGESFIKSYHREYGLEYTIFRFFNTYGPRQSIDFVVSKFLHAALKNQEITIYGDGLQTRTFCFIDDNIEATVNAFEGNKYVNDVVNIGSEKEIPIINLAKEIIKICKSKSKIIHLPALKEGDMTRRQPDTSKMKILLKHKLTPLQEGLTATMISGRF
jgi:nucleoside-diphosphate-sugar epimerase